MIENQALSFDGVEYEWCIDSDGESPAKSWNWFEHISREMPSEAIVKKLNKEFFNKYADRLCSHLESEERPLFYSILESMGAHPNFITYLEDRNKERPKSDRTASKPMEKSWPRKSPLSLIGYIAGENGLKDNPRRAILRRIYEETLPNSHSTEYMSKWGEPGTHMRLEKMARFLAEFCRKQRRKQSPSQQAIRDYESDLEWLKDEYYSKEMGFHWPDTSI